MFQQGDDPNTAHAEASHPGPKSARALRAELDEIFAKEARTGVKADPERVAAYVAAIEDAEADQHSAAPSQEDFEKTWTHFTENHPDLFPPTKTKPRKRGRRILHFVEAAALIAVVLVVTAAACGWQDYIVEWGRELLRITPAPSGVMALAEPNTDGYSTLAEAVAGAGMEDARAPAWIPARFSNTAINRFTRLKSIPTVVLLGIWKFVCATNACISIIRGRVPSIEHTTAEPEASTGLPSSIT